MTKDRISDQHWSLNAFDYFLHVFLYSKFGVYCVFCEAFEVSVCRVTYQLLTFVVNLQPKPSDFAPSRNRTVCRHTGPKGFIIFENSVLIRNIGLKLIGNSPKSIGVSAKELEVGSKVVELNAISIWVYGFISGVFSRVQSMRVSWARCWINILRMNLNRLCTNLELLCIALNRLCFLLNRPCKNPDRLCRIMNQL